MELLIILIVLVLLGGLLMGPIGFFKAMATASKADELEQHLDRLELELNDTRTRCLQLRAELRAMQQPTSDPQPTDKTMVQTEEPATEATVEVEPLMDEQVAAEPTPIDELTTLRHLLDMQQRHRTDEPAPICEPVAAIEEQAMQLADEPPAPPVSNRPPVEPYEADEPIARRLTIEEVLAGKVFVWIGAIALVLTAAFLLKLGFDEGIITKPVRVIGAGVFGLALWCVGEWARSRVGLIAQALCGAAVAVLYGTIIAAQHYDLLGASSTLAFGLMALVTAAAVALSLRHGPAVAILGMLGGFMLPPLLTQQFGPTSGMVLYLIAIEVGVLAVTGKRGWFGISLMTLIFSVAWSIGYTLIGDNALDRTLTAMLVLATAGAYLFHTARIHRDPAAATGTRRRVLGLSIAATCSAIGIVALLAVMGGFTLRDLGMLWLVAAGTLVLARLDARQLAMPFVAMGLSVLVLFSHAVRSLPAPPSDTLITMAGCFGGLFLLAGYVCMWASHQRRAFALMCAIAGPAFYGLVVFAGHEALGYREMWWPYTLGLAGVYALATLPLLLRRKAEHDWAIALFSVLSFVLVCVSLGQALDHPWFAVSLALVSAAAALIDLRLYIGPLRLAAAVVAFVSAGLLVVPGPLDLTIHGGPIFNTLLPMYLLPAIAFAIIAWSAARAGSSRTARNLTWLSMATLAAMLLVLTRDIYQPADFIAQAFALYEWSTYATVLLLAGFVSHAVGRKLNHQPILHATRCLVGIGAILGLVGGLIPSNPLFNRDVFGGTTLAAGLLALYAAPAALMWLWSRRPTIAGVPPLANALRVASITLVTLFVGLQIRNAFQTDNLHVLHIGMFECATYGLAWVALGFFLHFISPRCTLPRVTSATGRTVFGVGLATLLLGNVLVLNPLWFRETVGSLPVFNGLWFLYGPTILILALLARKARQQQRKPLARLAGYLAIALAFMLLSMFVRQGFAGNGLVTITSNLASAERYAYSLAWVLFGGALLVAGVFTRLDTLRYGSLAVLLLAVGKVFLIDTANLEDLYRVFSFFGLGVTLIGLGYLYQRLVFKRTNEPMKAAPQP